MPKQIFIVGFFCLIFVRTAFGQGFDWQYSARMPADSPVLFFGLNGEYNLIYNKTEIDLFEDHAPCSTFHNGWGGAIAIGLQSEYWTAGKLALFANIKYSRIDDRFRTNASSIPLNDTVQLYTQYEFTSTLSYITIDAGVKYRLFNSHLFIGAGFQADVLIQQEAKHTEKVLSPDWYYFSTVPPTQSRIVSNGRISDINLIYIIPKVILGYDLNLGLSTYATIYAAAGLPVMDVTATAGWKRWTLTGGISILRGF